MSLKDVLHKVSHRNKLFMSLREVLHKFTVDINNSSRGRDKQT